MNVTERFNRNQKQLAVLVDPDKLDNDQLESLTTTSQKAGVDFFFVGGSLLTSGSLNTCVKILKANSNIPAVLFPGNTYQVSNHADAILFLIDDEQYAHQGISAQNYVQSMSWENTYCKRVEQIFKI